MGTRYDPPNALRSLRRVLVEVGKRVPIYPSQRLPSALAGDASFQLKHDRLIGVVLEAGGAKRKVADSHASDIERRVDFHSAVIGMWCRPTDTGWQVFPRIYQRHVGVRHPASISPVQPGGESIKPIYALRG